MNVAYSDLASDPDSPHVYHSDPVSLARASDVLVATTAGGAGTRNLVGAAVFDALGPEGLFVNVSRGTVVDETALIGALGEKRIGAAALDVFWNEPDIDARLLGFPNVVVQPHHASGTVEARRAMGKLSCADDLRSFRWPTFADAGDLVSKISRAARRPCRPTAPASANATGRRRPRSRPAKRRNLHRLAALMWRGGGVVNPLCKGAVGRAPIARRELIRVVFETLANVRATLLLHAGANRFAPTRYGAMLSLQHMISLLWLQALGLATATLTVCNLEDDIVRRLRIRAAEHDRSAEAEHREILRLALIGQTASNGETRSLAWSNSDDEPPAGDRLPQPNFSTRRAPS